MKNVTVMLFAGTTEGRRLCGYLAEKLGDHIDMISCGANLYDVHTPHEKADVESFYRMEEVIIAILQEIAKA